MARSRARSCLIRRNCGSLRISGEVIVVLAGWLEEYLEKRHKKRLAENRAAARAAGRAEANAAWGA
jgi:hypothetical protein